MSNYDIIKEIYKVVKEHEAKQDWDKDGEEEMAKIKLLLEKKRPHIR